jgi:hypothetical protein
LTWLNLSGNSLLIGTVPDQLCNLVTSITMNVYCNPGPQCSCCYCWPPD